MYILKIRRASFLLLFSLFSIFTYQSAFSQTKDQTLNLIWQGLGGKQAWNDARYFMFTCHANLGGIFDQEHVYIWDRSSGDCRFEGTIEQEQKIVVLFNAISNKGKAFIDNRPIGNRDSATHILLPVIEAFNRETFWLFPSKSLTDTSLLTVKDTELIGSARYNVVELQLPIADSIQIKSKVYIDTNTGRIFQWQTLDKEENIVYNFLTSNFKDVGGGLILPTIFTDTKKGSYLKFPIVSALINIESDKLSKP